jgi:hypothetical protein
VVWKAGQSGNYNGRPRAAYHWDGEKIVEDTSEYHAYKASIKRKREEADKMQDQYKETITSLIKNGLASTDELPLPDPVLFQHKLLGNELLPIGLRVAIAQNIAPYCHPKVGLISMPRYVETPIKVPAFQSIEEAEDFLLGLSQRLGAGELSIDAATQVTVQIQAWIHSKRQGQELDLKIQAATATGPQVIKILGGLPNLPGTSVIMPTFEPMGKLGPETPPAEPDVLATESPPDPAE